MGQQKQLTALVPYVGDISVMDRARVTNWFDVHIARGERKEPHTCIGLLSLAHAFTLLLASHLRYRITGDPEYPATAGVQDREKFVLNKCWDHQVESNSSNARIEIDVDKECLWCSSLSHHLICANIWLHEKIPRFLNPLAK